MISLVIIVLLGYFVGSIPGSLWVGKWFYNVDLREHGSGNPGATNAYRVLGWKAGLMATVIDMGKGYVAAGLIPGLVLVMQIDTVPFADSTGLLLSILGGAAAVVGHMFPIWARFKGGKGVNTAAGILIAITPLNMLIVFIVFCLVLWRTSYVSLASMTASATYPISLVVQKYVLGENISVGLIIFAVLLAGGIILAHHSNIKRLLNGAENKISRTRSSDTINKPAH